MRDLVYADKLTPRGGKMYWSGERAPAREVGLRTGSSVEYRFIDLPDPLPEFTFVYTAPTLIIDVPIEFEIESVPVAARRAAVKIIQK